MLTPWSTRFWPGALLLALGLGLLWPAPAAAAESLEKGLRTHAPALIRYLQQQPGCQNVGVLKFRVKKGSEPPTDDAGLLTLNLAHRLELALILANDNDVAKQLGILRDPSAVAAKLPGANHLSASGRQALFQGTYPLAWGDKQVQADVFLTGLGHLSADLRTLTVYVLAFARQSPNKVEMIQKFEAAVDANTLFEVGESFQLRSLGTEPVLESRAAETALLVKTGKATNPLLDKAAPVTLDILYDGKKVPYELRAGKAVVPEPQENQKVVLAVRRNDPSPQRYGVVVQVNGVNVLYKEQLPPGQSPKWVLEPKSKGFQIAGFQVSATAMEPFKVLSRPESKSKEIYYGADVGTISLVVFREEKGPEPPPRLLKDEEEDVAALTRGIYPRGSAANLAVLKQRLWEEARRDDSQTRGLIQSDQSVQRRQVQAVTFRAEPVPLLTATISYYRPQGK